MMKLSKFSISPELIYRIKYPRSPKNIFIFVVALLLLTGVIYAATPLPTGTIAIYTYDVSGGTKQRLGNVEVKVNSVSAPYECPEQTKITAPASSGSSHGYAAFRQCPAGTYSGRKYLKYTLVQVKRSGYQIAHNSPFKVGADKSSSKAGSFAVRKKRVTKVNIYLTKNGSAALPPPGAPSASGNKGNIVSISQTIHATRYPLSQPDPGWISNYTNAYFLGSVYVGWSIDLVKLRSPDPDSQYGTESSNGYMFGLISRPDGSVVGCGWVEPGTVDKSTLQAHTNVCSNHPFLNPLQDESSINSIRVLFGKQFNCNKGVDICNSPVTLDPVDMNPNCANKTLYKNYFSGNDYTRGSFRDPIGQIDLTKADALRYRFTTLDGRAGVVAGAATYGWGFIDRSCINGWPTNDQYYARHPEITKPY